MTTIAPRLVPRRPHSRTNALERVADAGAALPIEHRPRGMIEGVVGPAPLERLRDAGQAGAEAKDLDV